jgi:class 3 adenylate cyclase
MESLETWLAALGLEKYASAFRAQEVGLDQLKDLSEADLKELGLPLGPRKRILEVAAKGLPPSPAPKTAPAAERRQVTIMFVDLVGSTAMSGRLDPEDLRAVLRAYHETCARAIERWGGLVAKLMGDGVLAYFGWPQAQETSAERAIRAGLDINASVAKLQTPAGEPLSARTGIATGVVVIGDLIGEGAAQEAAVAGETPNLAARLQGAADPGGLVVCDNTLTLAGAHFETRSMGALALKGFAALVAAHCVTAARAVETRFAARAGADLAPLLGRDHELALILERWRQAAAGDGQVVVLSGDAGLGKSRLADAVLRAIAGPGERPSRRIIWQCAPYHTATAFHPVAASLDPGTLPALAEDDRAALTALTGRGSLAAAGLTLAQSRHLTLSALGRWVTAQAPPGGAAVLLVEDAHWIDPSTLEALETNLDAWSRARVFVLVTARPGFQNDFGERASLTRLSLGRLDRAGAAALAAAALGGHRLPSEALDAVMAKAEGVPLYVEEIAKAFAASGAIVLRDGAWVMSGPLSASGVPASLAGGLMARLDRLPGAKETAQEASVAGRHCSYAEIAALSALDAKALHDALAELTGAQILTAQGDAPAGGYAFRHALLRDAAYDSLLKSRRAALHERLLTHLRGQPDAALELLAWHAEAAGRRAEALDLWRKAGEAAMARPAFREAIAHFRRAASLADGAEALAVETRLGLASIAAHGHSHTDTVAIFEAASKRPGLDRDAAASFVVWYGLWCGHHVRGEAHLAQGSAAALHAASLAHGAPANVMMGVRSLGITALMNGDAREALARHAEAEAMENIPRDRAQAQIVGQDQSVSFRSYYGLTLWLSGQGTRAWATIQDSIRLAREGGHPGSLGYGLTHAILGALGLGQREMAQTWCAELFDKASEFRLGMWRDYALRFQGLIDLAIGGGTEHLLAARQALAGRGVGLFAAYADLMAADLLLDRGALDDAAQWLARGKAALQPGHECWAAPEALRIGGRLAALQGDQAGAADLTARALARATEGGLLAFALKAAVQGVDLANAAGRAPDLRGLGLLAAQIEGPDELPALRSAKALLGRS